MTKNNDKMLKKEYEKMMRTYTRKLKDQADSAAPWDWGFMFKSIRTYIEFMYQYYALGYNVHQAEESCKPILDSLQVCMDIYYELDHIKDKLPYAELNLNDDDTVTVTCVDEEKYNKAIKEISSKEQKLYKQLFNTIRDNFQSWWD